MGHRKLPDYVLRMMTYQVKMEKHPYNEAYEAAGKEFRDKYGVLGEKLQTETELEEILLLE